jgi:hypothetical protein
MLSSNRGNVMAQAGRIWGICRRRILLLLNLTWGLPLSAAGLLTAICLVAVGKRPERYGFCLHFEVGQGWGGLEMGVVFLTETAPPTSLKDHELGHGIQNAVLGPLMPIVVCIPSAIRYWVRRLCSRLGRPPQNPYDSVWFEGQATRLGEGYFKSR